MQVIDAHHHLWRQADLPWLQGPMQPRIFGEYAAIMRDYPVEEYVADATSSGVVKSIYVQANWAAGQGLAEARWVQAVAGRAEFPQAIVAHADLSSPDAPADLRALCALESVRGIRQQMHWHENPLYRFASRPDLMNDAAWRRGFGELAPRGLLFELQIFAAQMDDGARLAADFPETIIVLEHAGMLEDRSAQGMLQWRRGMRLLAACPNVHVKLSGLGTFVREASARTMRPVVQETLSMFGPQRCLFGSNFPIEKLWCGYAELFAAFLASIDGLGAQERAAVLHDNAARLYRIQ